MSTDSPTVPSDPGGGSRPTGDRRTPAPAPAAADGPTAAAPPPHRPGTLGELRDAVLGTEGPITVRGADTAADWAARPDPAATGVSTTGLRGIVTHNPGDMTVAARPGTPLTELQEALAEHGQRIALDPARAARGATVGGLFATADAGPLAHTYGTLRDLVIGATVLLADGTTARSGGHVIKNVAGYDLTKLLHGAHGTLAVVVELVLRCHPVPPATATVALPADLATMTAAAEPLRAHPAEVTTLEWVVGEDARHGRLLARVEGTEEGVRGRVRRLGDELGVTALDPADADAAWAEHAAAVDARPPDGAVLRLGVAPSRLVPVLSELRTLGGRAVTAAPGLGVATLTLPAAAGLVGRAHELVAAAGGTSGLRHRPPGQPPQGVELPAWGPAPSSAALLRAVGASLDPQQRFGRGRLAPWIPAPSPTPAGAPA